MQCLRTLVPEHLISFCTVQLRTLYAARSLTALCLSMTSLQALGSFPASGAPWSSAMPHPSEGIGRQQQVGNCRLKVVVQSSTSFGCWLSPNQTSFSGAVLRKTAEGLHVLYLKLVVSLFFVCSLVSLCSSTPNKRQRSSKSWRYFPCSVCPGNASWRGR